MLMLIAALAASASGSSQPSRPPTARATASIRIVASVRVRVGADRTEEGQALKLVRLRAENGALVQARLVEFE